MKREDLERLADDPKTVLLMVPQAEGCIKEAEEEIAHYYDLATGITQVLKPVVTFTGGPGHKVEECVVGIMSLRERLNDTVRQYMDAVELAREAVAWLESPGQKQVLGLRYLCRKSWGSIAEDLDQSERWTYRQHAAALNEIKRIAKEKLDELQM